MSSTATGRVTGQPEGNTEGALRRILEDLGVQYRTVVELAHAVMRHAILTGQLAPGEKLRQEVLAREMGISREPIRSALLQLAADGLVVIHPHRGAIVSTLTVGQIREIYELRILLESYAVRRGIETMTPARLERLTRLAADLDRAMRSPSSVKLRLQFYEQLYDAEDNPFLVELIGRLREDVGRYWIHRRKVSEHEHGHRPLLECAIRGDADGAVAWLTVHFQEIVHELLETVEDNLA